MDFQKSLNLAWPCAAPPGCGWAWLGAFQLDTNKNCSQGQLINTFYSKINDTVIKMFIFHSEPVISCCTHCPSKAFVL